MADSTLNASYERVDTDGDPIPVATVGDLTITGRSGGNTLEVLGSRGDVVRTIVNPELAAEFRAAVANYTNGAPKSDAQLTQTARSVFRS
ncbi:MAG: hypothetical protein J0M34_00400 [Alphaproteobacteria bacterium]|nr:hypothetical protein [Alphaproteobacteria bacterium]